MGVVKFLVNGLAQLANKLFVKTKLLPDDPIKQFNLDVKAPTFYISRLNSAADLASLTTICKQLGLPNPNGTERLLADINVERYLCLQNTTPLFGDVAKQTNALKQGEVLFQALQQNPSLNIQIIPVSILWGRNPGKEKAGLGTLLSHSLTPSWLRKIFVVLLSGRGNLIRFSQPLDLAPLLSRKTKRQDLPHALLRVARFHFKRQKLAATGPKLPSRDHLFQSLLAAPHVKQAISDEAKAKNISEIEAKKIAQQLLGEIAANYNDAMISIGDRILTWLWTKLYNGIEVNYTDKIHELAHKGHEIIYVPCHRSHMDYLLLTYVIYHQGLVPPHIAAGVNLNFWPAGPIFRRSGAFFIRRTFQGNKLYSTIFREYLSQLFIKGYSIKFYTEGGRSRTGRLLPPKTGMLAMTLQAMLRDIERPVSVVPVYIGYEHVMEVNTYLKELAGSVKAKESMFGIIKTIKNLKNYGHGYVNFGEPINLNQYLNQHQPDWRANIDSNQVQKPQWLNSQVAAISNQIMTHINSAAALNSVNLLAIILLQTEQKALSQSQTICQLNFYLQLFKDAKYSDTISMPNKTAQELLNHALTLGKFELVDDIVAINDKEVILLNYYRNNIIHLFAVPSLLALHIIRARTTNVVDCIEKVKTLYPLFAAEWFMSPLDEQYITSVVTAFAEQGLISLDAKNNISISQSSSSYFMLDLLGRVLDCTLQRYAVVIGLLTEQSRMDKSDLESSSHLLAARLSKLHGINTPEFYDQKVLTGLIAGLKDLNLVELNEQNQLISTEQLQHTSAVIKSLLKPPVLLSIQNQLSGHH